MTAANGDVDHHDAHGHPPTSGLRGRLRALIAGDGHDHSELVDGALASGQRGIRAVKVSLAALLVTGFVQLGIFAVTNSVGLLADTIHNFTDALTSLPLWIAFILGARPASNRYTFGYRRAEDLAGLFVLLMIALSAVIAAVESALRLMEPEPISNIGAVAVAGVMGFIGNELVAIYRIREGKAIGSAALVADGYHARTDGLTSLAVVIGAAGVWAGFPLADPIVGLLISLTLLIVLRQAAGQMIGRLMDAIDPALVQQAERLAGEVPGVERVGRLRLRWLGHSLEASLAITVDRTLSVADAHEISEEVRRRLFHGIRRLETVIVHIDPSEGPAGEQRLTYHHDQPTRHEDQDRE
jgi:cation diffusion facilitator family transporter